MTAQELRETVVRKALSFLGRKESDGSHREIVDIYNSIKPLPNGYRMKYTDPWCAAFVSAVAWLCGLTDIIIPSASCPDMVAKYKAAGRWTENDAYKPQLGDIVFYDWQDSGSGDNTGMPDHVGIVSEVYSNSFNVVEGNASDMVKVRTMHVNGRYIRGFGLPDYASAAKNGENTGAEQEIPVTDSGSTGGNTAAGRPEGTPDTGTTAAGKQKVTLNCTVRLPMLKQGMENGYVTAFQVLLLARGYSVGGSVKNGKEQPDGQFGPTMRKNVVAWQKKAGLGADGIVGEQSWGAILAGK